MTTLKRAAKLPTTDNLVVVADKNDKLDQFGLSAEERKYALNHLKNAQDKFLHLNLLKRQVFIGIVDPSEKNEWRTRERFRQIGAKATKAANDLKLKSLTVANFFANQEFALATAEGAALANYQFLKYFKAKKEKQNSLTTVKVWSKGLKAAAVEELQNVLNATAHARTLVNEPVSFLTAPQLAKEIQKLGKEAGFKVEVLNKAKIKALKMGGLLAVNYGSIDPPTFTIMEHKPKKAKNKKPVVLVGKGVVYDTGGLSLKPTPNSMDIMKCDMGGAAAMIGTMYAIAKNDLPIHVIGLIPATDNRPGQNAYAPGDVITMYDGTTVEVLNTDAEGRMLLADALAYAKKYNPDLVMDAATLTGAAVRAIGEYASAIMGTAEDSALQALEVSGYKTFERVVKFPMWDEYRDELRSPIADITNLGGPGAGQITAGKFLEHFTDYPWIHVDIAGPAWVQKEDSYRLAGGSGVGVRLFYDFIKNHY